ncbi:MAG: DNA methyltransferase, partial [Chloroflexota bacterium]|nr:DNA methyltransferase [Chloroflexota bacterium]
MTRPLAYYARLGLMTDPDGLVVAPFAGSNITGEIAERLGRRWLAFEIVEDYLEASKFRFPGLNEQPPLFTMRTKTRAVETV